MDGDVYVAIEKGALELIGEEALASDLGKGPVEDPVSRRSEKHDLALEVGFRSEEPFSYPFGLATSELGAPRADPDHIALRLHRACLLRGRKRSRWPPRTPPPSPTPPRP